MIPSPTEMEYLAILSDFMPRTIADVASRSTGQPKLNRVGESLQRLRKRKLVTSRKHTNGDISVVRYEITNAGHDALDAGRKFYRRVSEL